MLQENSSAEVNVACSLCSGSMTQRKTALAEWEVSWMRKCSESLTQLLAIEGFDPAYLETGNYCDKCIALLRDVDFTLRTVTSLNTQLEQMRTQITQFLVNRVDCISNKVSIKSEAEVSSCEIKIEPQDTEEGDAGVLNTTDSLPVPEVSESIIEDQIQTNFPSPHITRLSTRVLRSKTFLREESEDEFEIAFEEDEDWQVESDEESDTNYVDDENFEDKIIHTNTIEKVPRDNVLKRKKLHDEEDEVDKNLENTSNVSASKFVQTKNPRKRKSNAASEETFLQQMKSDAWRRSDDEIKSMLSKFVQNLSQNLSENFIQIPEQEGSVEDLLVYLLQAEIEENNETASTYVCTVAECSARFPNLRFLRQHMTREHGDILELGAFQCNICRSRLPTGQSLDAHIHARHENDVRPHHCEAERCTKNYTKSSELNNHTQKHHPEVYAKLDKPNESYFKYRDKALMASEPFVKQQKSKLKYVCSENECTFRTNSEQNLKFHRLDKHEKVALPYPCPKCGRAYKTRKGFDAHPCIVGNDHQCELCGKAFRAPHRLNLHKRLTHNDAATFKCSICERAYFSTDEVEEHEKLHTPSSGFSCVLNNCLMPECASLETLRAHVAGAAHDSRKAIRVCATCGYMSKGMKATSRMEEHMRTHTAVEPYSCRFCDKRFKTRPVLKSHEEINHPDLVEKRIYSCKLCPETFTVAQYLFKHNAWHKYGRNACRSVAKKKQD